nr:alpha/beta hydrolase-fold protein [Frondihabitans australicus]
MGAGAGRIRSRHDLTPGPPHAPRRRCRRRPGRGDGRRRRRPRRPARPLDDLPRPRARRRRGHRAARRRGSGRHGHLRLTQASREDRRLLDRLPAGLDSGRPPAVAVVLHGFGGSHASAFDRNFHLDRFLAAAVKSGAAPFALASVDGGNTYWHRRATGEDSGAMVADEFLPLLASKGLDTGRIGLLGWSMGAYGALLIGGQLGSARVAAVTAESVALWHTADRATASAFDGAADFAEHTLYGRQHLLDGVAVRVDCGTGDGFCPNDRDYVAGFATRPAGGFTPGGHDSAYWRRIAPAQMTFLAAHLTKG